MTIPRLSSADLETIAHTDFPDSIGLRLGVSKEDMRCYDSEKERKILKLLLHNFRRDPFTETRMQYFGRTIKHYTSKDTINNAIDYIKTYVKK